MTVAEHRLDLQTPDGVMDVYEFRPEGTGPWPGAIMYMDAMAIRPDLKGMAERLASNGYVVFLPNLFYRSGPIPPVDPATFVKPGPERERVFKLIQSIDGPKVMSDTGALLDHIAAQQFVRSPIGTVGYCMGGGYALLAAGTFPDRVAAAASFHGGSLATDRPDSPHLLASQIRARVYVAAAALDHMFSDEQRIRLERALTDAGVDFKLETYADMKHGFAVVGHPVYDAAGSERHWRELLKLFRDTLSAS